MILIPEMFALGMQERGWYVRSQIVWAKTSAMPESVRDRPTSAWEPIWMFAKSRAYFYDAEAVREPLKQPAVKVPQGFGGHKRNGGTTYSGNPYDASQLGGANLRNFWLLGPEPSRLEHYAGFVTELPKRCILAGTSERGACPACGSPWVRVVERSGTYQSRKALGYGGACNFSPTAHNATHAPGMKHDLDARVQTTGWQPGCSCPPSDPVPCVVLDPFAGSGTSGLVADRLGRDAVLIELNPAYAEMARKRIDGDAPLVSEPVAVDVPRQQPLFDAAAGGVR